MNFVEALASAPLEPKVTEKEVVPSADLETT